MPVCSFNDLALFLKSILLFCGLVKGFFWKLANILLTGGPRLCWVPGVSSCVPDTLVAATAPTKVSGTKRVVDDTAVSLAAWQNGLHQ